VIKMQKRLYRFSLLFFYITLIIMGLFFIFNVNANVRLAHHFPIYIAQDKAFSFQLRDNLTTYLTINATNNAFNVTVDTLIMRSDEGHFLFTPEANNTIRLTHNMDYVTIEGQNHTTEATQISFINNNLGIFENEQVIIIFKIKPYDVSDVWFTIFMFGMCICALVTTPVISDIVTKDKMEHIFLWVCGWLFFGILFFVLIYM